MQRGNYDQKTDIYSTGLIFYETMVALEENRKEIFWAISEEKHNFGKFYYVVFIISLFSVL